jgi:predicted phage terminase large subunit-like protein
MIYVSDSMDNGVKSARKNIQFRYENSDFLKEWIPEATFTDNYLEFTNREGHKLGVKMFGAKTGIRGTKIFGKRPTLCVLDDLVSDDDAKSTAAMNAIKDTVYKGINYALDPTRRKIVFNGTPFHSTDIMVEAVEVRRLGRQRVAGLRTLAVPARGIRRRLGGSLHLRLRGQDYEDAVLNGKVAGFMQELMLRISSEEERLVQDGEIREYPRAKLLSRKSAYNFYITTDFATSEKQSADYSVISVWAYNANGDWFWVDGIAERQDMGKTLDDLFRLVSLYRPQSVGIETTGQQGGFIKWIQEQMLTRNIWFNFASSEKAGTPGIRPVQNKLTRFNQIVPQFKAGKIYFPTEMKTSKIMGMFYSQIKLATKSGLKGKDDCIDTISQLIYMNPWRPTDDAHASSDDSPGLGHNGGPDWDDDEREEEGHGLASYIV